jgi:hypothetical protein
LSDANAIGKSKHIQLVLVKNSNVQCNAGYFILMRHASHLLAAFREPFLDAAKLTDEARANMTDQGRDGAKTTRK